MKKEQMYSSLHGVFLGFLCFSSTHNIKFQTNKAGNKACPKSSPPNMQSNIDLPILPRINISKINYYMCVCLMLLTDTILIVLIFLS